MLILEIALVVWVAGAFLIVWFELSQGTFTAGSFALALVWPLAGAVALVFRGLIIPAVHRRERRRSMEALDV